MAPMELCNAVPRYARLQQSKRDTRVDLVRVVRMNQNAVAAALCGRTP
jgi:hypothetical protein